MKRVFAFALALAMVLTLSTAVFADEPTTGSITITNATIGHTYKLYKIFDATYAKAGNGVTYSITPTIKDAEDHDIPNRVYQYMFNPTSITDVAVLDNLYFTYNSTKGTVERIDGTDKEDIVAYLTQMIRDGYYNETECETQIAGSNTLVFDNLSFGYYLIDKDPSQDVAVTIDSNTPDVEVIDKNQKPGTNFDKNIMEEDAEGNEVPVKTNSANVGDLIKFQINFDATNYDGEYLVEQYAVKDTKGSGLWVEFDSIKVWVEYPNGTKESLDYGFYFNAGPADINTHEWDDGLGLWAEEGNDETPVEDNADWYLIHHTFDSFDIVIPWLQDHDFQGGNGDYELVYPEDEELEPRFNSNVKVYITYDAYVKHDAALGAPSLGNLWNEADLVWYFNDTNDSPPDIPSTETTVFALALTKYDTDTPSKHLAGAKFEIFQDPEHLYPVYVIPTDIEGVYIVDDFGVGENVTGSNKKSVREVYGGTKLTEYLGDKAQKNEVVTPVNGKVVILGLAAGEYYLVETEAPNGYNDLNRDIIVTVDETNRANFFVIYDENNNAVDKQSSVEDNHFRKDFVATHVGVGNSQGTELPSTGGEGTMLMITIGTMVALAFAVLLITHKKMTAYRD